jgi:hypothetical protein
MEGSKSQPRRRQLLPIYENPQSASDEPLSLTTGRSIFRLTKPRLSLF